MFFFYWKIGGRGCADLGELRAGCRSVQCDALRSKCARCLVRADEGCSWALLVCSRVCSCVRVECVCARALVRTYMSLRVCVRAHSYLRLCLRLCLYLCLCMCVCVCVGACVCFLCESHVCLCVSVSVSVSVSFSVCACVSVPVSLSATVCVTVCAREPVTYPHARNETRTHANSIHTHTQNTRTETYKF